MVGPLNEGSFVPAVDIREVLGLHDEPDSLDGVEVGRIRRKMDGLEEVPVEALPFVPRGVVEDKDVPFPGGSDRSRRFIEKSLEDISIAMTCLNSEKLTRAGADGP